MEKIRINEISKKPCRSGGELVIVAYVHDGGNAVIKEATLNTKWQAQEVDYLEKDVGIGGEVKVMITQKGDYTNITKVDFTSAVRGINTGGSANTPIAPSPAKTIGEDLDRVFGTQQGVRSINGQEQMSVQSEQLKMIPIQYNKDKSIIAQCLVKAVIGQYQDVKLTIKHAVGMYKEALDLLG